MARKLGVDGFCEVSALIGEGVKEAFDGLHIKAVQNLKTEAARRHSMAQQVAARPTSVKVQRSALQVNMSRHSTTGRHRQCFYSAQVLLNILFVVVVLFNTAQGWSNEQFSQHAIRHSATR
jgi:hypothetical protein